MTAGRAPSIADSTREERATYVRRRYVCIADCDQCGICATFHGKDSETALAPYISGEREFLDVVMSYRR